MANTTTNVTMDGTFKELADVGDLYKITNYKMQYAGSDCEIVFASSAPSETLKGHHIVPGAGIDHLTWGTDAQVYGKGRTGVIIIVTK